MDGGKGGRQFKRRARKGEIIAAPQAAALACLGPVRNWQPKQLCVPISSWEPTAPGEQNARYYQQAGSLLIITRVLFSPWPRRAKGRPGEGGINLSVAMFCYEIRCSGIGN